MKGNSLVIQLQKDALNSKIEITDLLRIAYVVADKLDIKDFKEWLLLEQNGYYDIDVPKYRKAIGELKALNPNGGWIPVHIPVEEFDEIITHQPIGMPVSEMEEAINISKETGGKHLEFGIPHKVEMDLNKYTAQSQISPTYFKMRLHIPIMQFSRILQAVRDQILRWALELGKKGILGEDMVFTDEEKNAASTVNYEINIEQMHNSQIQQGTKFSDQSFQSISPQNHYCPVKIGTIVVMGL